jgi:ribosome-binding protein aMBF1 (putative translation factor)
VTKTIAKPRTLTRKEKQLLSQDVRERIRYARNKNGLSQQQLADLIGGDRIQVNKWEAGTYKPGLDYRRKLAEATGYPIGFFGHDGPGGQDE